MMTVLVFLFVAFSQAEVIDRVYATVNDEVITESDIEDYHKQLKSRLLYEEQLFPDEKSILAVNDRRVLLDKLIGEKSWTRKRRNSGSISEDREQRTKPRRLPTLL